MNGSGLCSMRGGIYGRCSMDRYELSYFYGRVKMGLCFIGPEWVCVLWIGMNWPRQ
jgi:hypothetical protein